MMITIRSFMAVALAVLVVATPVRAQDQDAAFRADVEKLLEVTGAAAMGTQMATLVSNQVINGFRRQQPSVPDRAVEIIKEELNAEFAKMFEPASTFRQTLITIHMKHFTHDEVKTLLEFYNTPVGRKAIAVMPLAAQEGAAAGQEWAGQNMPRITATLQERLRAEGFIK